MKKTKNKKFKKAGFSLAEVLFSIMIISFGIVAVLILLTGSMKASVSAKNQVIAAGLAQEGIELVKNLKDNRPQDFSSVSNGQNYRIDHVNSDALDLNNGKQLFKDGSGFFSHSLGTPTKFYRKIGITSDTENQYVTSYVSWNNANDPFLNCNLANSCMEIISVLPKVD